MSAPPGIAARQATADPGPALTRAVRLRKAAQARLARVLERRVALPRDAGPAITLCFDDVPVSAATQGAEILGRFGARATFYVSAGLTVTDLGVPCADPDALRALVQRGHEIGCHGFGHIDYQDADRTALLSDLDANAARFAEIGLPRALTFAYPYARVSPLAKAVCGARFRCCRGGAEGPIQGPVDRAMLPAVPLVAHPGASRAIDALMAQVAHRGGLLALVSHGVTDDPGPYDCSPAQLTRVLENAESLGLPALTMKEALERGFVDPGD